MSIARSPRSSVPQTSAGHRTDVFLGCVALLVGVAAWVAYYRADLVLSHYDAKAHLVVARRVIDNLTPGWQQVGAVWLPLPHLLLLLPVQNDLLYRTGLAGSTISLVCFALAAYAIARVIRLVTGSLPGAVTGVALFALNPNLLYLATTPMTEPLLLASVLLVILGLTVWIESDDDTPPRWLPALLFLTAWTRYEAWFVLAAAGVLTAVLMWARGLSWAHLTSRAATYAIPPLMAAMIFVVESRVTVGQWFVSDGFFVPDPTYAGRPGAVLGAIFDGTVGLSGHALVCVALASVLVTTGAACVRPSWRTAALNLALLASAALPFAAFYDGHPFRIRYMTPLVAAAALWCGLVVGRLRPRAAWSLAVVIVGLGMVQAPPWDPGAAMVKEAQLDRPNSLARRTVSACLSRGYRGEKILTSMGSLAHYMQELSWQGLALSDFVHEGNGVIWDRALETGPAPHVGWMLVEEVAEGGDVLAQHIRAEPAFTRGMTRVCASGGVALYKRSAPES